MDHHICVTCGAHSEAAADPPLSCLICEDERQYVGHEGQCWTTLAELRREHSNTVEPIDPGLTGFATEPSFAIGQQAHLIETRAGNVLWNCINLVDADTIAAIERRGGLAAIAVSHPHFFTSVAEWSRAFGRCRSSSMLMTARGSPAPMRRSSSGTATRRILCRGVV